MAPGTDTTPITHRSHTGQVLPDLSPVAVLTAWRLEPVAAVAMAAAAVCYVRAVRRARHAGGPRLWQWSARHGWSFGGGLALAAWTTCGLPEVYGDRLFWIWTVQHLLLLLVVPALLLTGRPLELATTLAPRGVTARLLQTRAVRFLSAPVVGPALVPVLSGVLFFGPVAAWAITVPLFGWVLHVAVVLVGAIVMLPVLGVRPPRSSLAAGVAMAAGTAELALAALPGALLRLHNSPATSWFDVRRPAPWLPPALVDQHIAGAVLLLVGELLALPFVALVFRQWLRADARDAAEVDVVLEAERAVRGPLEVPEDMVEDEPWWLSDPEMQERLRRHG